MLPSHSFLHFLYLVQQGSISSPPYYIFGPSAYFKCCSKSGLSGLVLGPLSSTAGGRFPRAWLEPPRSLRSLWGLKAHGTALSFAPPKTFCYSRRTRRASEALLRTKKIGLYLLGSAEFRSNQRDID